MIAEQSSPTSQLYTCRLVCVYHGLTDELAQHLAHRHNRATEFTSKMTTQDKVGNVYKITCSQRYC